MPDLKSTTYAVTEDGTIVTRTRTDRTNDTGQLTHQGTEQMEIFRPHAPLRSGLAAEAVDPHVTQLARLLWPGFQDWAALDALEPREVERVSVSIDAARNIFVTSRKDITDGAGTVTHTGQAHRATFGLNKPLPPGIRAASVPATVTALATIFWPDFKGWTETPPAPPMKATKK